MLRACRLAGLVSALLAGALSLGGCTAPALALTAVGIGTDTSMTWDIVKHVHGIITEDDPTPCAMLNSVQRAVNGRCAYVPGSIRVADIAKSGLQGCALTAATQDARLWRALPELIDKGAKFETCARSPLQDLAEADACPDFQSASPEVLTSLVFLAEKDPRAVRHDVFRMLGCSRARAVGLDQVLYTWLDRGSLAPGTLSFSPFEALDPDLLNSRMARELVVAGYSPSSALDNYDGTLPSGFEEALRRSHWPALDWWFYELPQLANLAPPSRGGQMNWVPLQRVLLPGFLQDASSQGQMVTYLLAHGADPRKKLPFDPDKTVITFAAAIKSPMLALLQPPAPPATAPTTLARGGAEAGTRSAGAKPPRDNPAARPVRQAARFDPKAPSDDTTPR
jgi:hypothetical protein